MRSLTPVYVRECEVASGWGAYLRWAVRTFGLSREGRASKRFRYPWSIPSVSLRYRYILFFFKFENR